MPEQARSTTQTYQPEGSPPRTSTHHSGNLNGNSGNDSRSDAPAAELRPRLMRLALLPVAMVAVVGAGVAVFLSQASSSGPSWMPLAVIGCAVILVVVIGYFAVHTATAIDDGLGRKLAATRRSTVETHFKVWHVLDDLQRHLPADQRWSAPLPTSAEASVSTDEAIRLLGTEARQLRAAAEAIAQRLQAQGGPQPGRGGRPGQNGRPARSGQLPQALPASPAAASPAAMAARNDIASGAIDMADVHPRVGIFVNLARRLQSLVHREIEQLDELENQVEDPDLLKGLFSVDHLATRIRRHAENLAVLGGATSHRQWSRPVNVYEALRSAVAEVEQYARVKLVRPVDGTLKGHAVADIIHLVAELVENATTFSAPTTQVLIRVQRVRTGLAVEVEDRGLGLENEERERFNKMLATPDEVDLDELLADGRIGLYVVSSLAGRHSLTVQLQSNIFGGTQAVLIVPSILLGDTPDEGAPRELPAAPRQIPTGPAVPPPPAAVPAAPAPREATAGAPAMPAGTSQFPVRQPGAALASAGGPSASAPAPSGPSNGAGPDLPSVQMPNGTAMNGSTGQHARPLPSAGSGRPTAGMNGSTPRLDAAPAPHFSPPTGGDIPPATSSFEAFTPAPLDSSSGSYSSSPSSSSFDSPYESSPYGSDPYGSDPYGASSNDTGALPVTAEMPAIDAGTAQGTVESDSRPALPKRNKQTHLAPQLRELPEHTSRGSESGHDPGLMAAFQQGQHRADEKPGNQGDAPDGTQIPSSDNPVTPYRHEEA